MFTFSVVVVDLSIDCILSFLFPADTDVLVPVLSQSTDVVVVNFVVVLKFPNIDFKQWPYWNFSKGSTHDFGQKMEILPYPSLDEIKMVGLT